MSRPQRSEAKRTAAPEAAALRSRPWEATARLRRDASALLVDAALAAGASRYIQESLAFAYPDGGDDWLGEDVRLEPHPLQAAVLDAEAAARRFVTGAGVGVVLRFGAFYGAGSTHTQAELAAARRGWAIRPGRPDAYTPVVHLDDAARAVSIALAAPPGTYNVVDDEPLTRTGHAAALAAALGLPHLRQPPRALGHLGKLRALARSHRVCNARLRAAGWHAAYPSAREGWPQVAAATSAPGAADPRW
jgi:nucleoside-diphosphate-sugar epimerase